jgi:hypothetical protein
MEHQREDRAISEMTSNGQKELFDIFLMDVSGEAVTLVNVMPVGDDWVGDFIFTDICDVVKERAGQSAFCRLCPVPVPAFAAIR